MIKDANAKSIVDTATKCFEKMQNLHDSKHPTIQMIFHDWWDEFLKLPEVIKCGVRPIVHKEVERMLSCGTLDAGFEVFECPNCHKHHIICYTCKSRFCSSCGVKYAKERAKALSAVSLDVKHRHVVFTIDDRLRLYFRKYPDMLNLLFEAVSDTITFVFGNMKGKKNKITPGLVLTLHTFGRPLNWNPHIHALLTEGGMDKTGIYRSINHINYKSLRHSFMRCILYKMRDYLAQYPEEQKKFKKLMAEIYKDDMNGFYVYAPPIKNQKDKDGLINYIIRYTSRPAMAQSRIMNYDYDKCEITYYYDDHKTNERIVVTESVFAFIGKLIKHIPEEQFKMTRYYGIYASCNHKLKNHVRRLKQKANHIRKKVLSYRKELISIFNVDPLLCSCGHYMEFVDNYVPQRKGVSMTYE